MEINASQFKARCLRLIDEVDQTGEEIVIVKRGRPVARVVPFQHEHQDQPWLALRGTGRFVGDPFKPVIKRSDIDALK